MAPGFSGIQPLAPRPALIAIQLATSGEYPSDSTAATASARAPR